MHHCWREIIKGSAIKNVVCGKDLRPLPIKVQLKGGQTHLHKNRRSIAVWIVWLVECETASQSSAFWCTLHAKKWLNAANENVPDTTVGVIKLPEETFKVQHPVVLHNHTNVRAEGVFLLTLQSTLLFD